MALDRAKWIQADRLRWARQFDVPMAEEWPDRFPDISTLSVMIPGSSKLNFKAKDDFSGSTGNLRVFSSMP